MKNARQLAAGLLILASLAAPQALRAQDAAAPAAAFTAAQLEQIVAPIALYPDALVSQILMASTYPLEIVEAARWSAQNASLKGTALEGALKDKSWDPSVKSLCGFPDVLKRMNDNLDWTQDMGDAFLGQKSDVLDTVQRMRGKAYDAGNLKTTEQQTVTVKEEKIIVIEPAEPEVIYVPTYSPTVVYGSAWYYPAPYYPAVYAPPGYGLLAFTAGVAWGAAMWGNCNWGWGHGDVDINVNHYNNFNRNTNINADRTNISGSGNQGWKHDASHRKGVNYSNPNVAKQYGGSGASSRVSSQQARGWSGAQGAGARPSTGAVGTGAGARPSTGAVGAGQRPSTGATAGARPSTGAAQRPSTPAQRPSGAYSGASSSSLDRSASSRGASSRGSTSYGGSRGGGGGAARGGGGGRR